MNKVHQHLLEQFFFCFETAIMICSARTVLFQLQNSEQELLPSRWFKFFFLMQTKHSKNFFNSSRNLLSIRHLWMIFVHNFTWISVNFLELFSFDFLLNHLRLFLWYSNLVILVLHICSCRELLFQITECSWNKFWTKLCEKIFKLAEKLN